MSQKEIKAAVIGDPISHSLSPKIHNHFLEKYHIKGSYEAIKIEKENLKEGIENLKINKFAGFNVTIPHKEEIFKICDFKSQTALLTKAVNTVVITNDGKLFGHNSDAEGFLNNLIQTHQDFEIKDKKAFVIGAGGAARAVIYSLIKSGASKVIITNRSEDRVQKIIEDFANFSSEKKCNLEFLNREDFENNLNECDLLVNSTSLGMVGQEPLKLDIKNLKKSAIVYDIVYNPLMTDLLKDAKKQGNKIVTGIGMLIHQALIGFELWFKEKPEIDYDLEKKLIS